jgi:integrase
MATNLLTLAELEQFFLTWLAGEVQGGRSRPRTLCYYRTWLDRFVAAAGGARPVAELVALDLERFKSGWHSVQAVQRLFNWGVEVGLLDKTPFRRVKRPALGQRQRILPAGHVLRLLRCCRRPLRDLLLGQLLTLGRPQELRALRWSNYHVDKHAFLLSDFKAKNRRKDSALWRVLPVCPRLGRLLERLRRRAPKGDGFVFLTAGGKAWTNNALRLAVRRAVHRAGLDAVAGEEPVVAYTLRHTAATQATANGVSDRRLADLLGHTSTRTTARYQHLQLEDLAEALQQAIRRRRA